MGNSSSKKRHHNQNNDISQYYEIGQQLGVGSFGTVYAAKRRSDRLPVALKQIRKSNLSPKDLTAIQGEVQILHRVKHPGCVALIEVFESPKTIYIIMELLSGGELFDSIVTRGFLSERETSRIIKQVTEAIQYLHSVGIVHRDLKPENLLFSDNTPSAKITITDFGLAKRQVDSGLLHTACGTPSYVAPEVLKQEPYTPAVDLWSIGVVLYVLLCGFPPFYSENTAKLYSKIISGSFTFPDPYWKDISPAAKDLIRGLLTVDAQQRLTCEEVLAHPWIQGDAASTKAFSIQYHQRLKLLQAKRKLRRSVQILIAANRFNSALIAATKYQQQIASPMTSPRHDLPSQPTTSPLSPQGPNEDGLPSLPPPNATPPLQTDKSSLASPSPDPWRDFSDRSPLGNNPTVPDPSTDQPCLNTDRVLQNAEFLMSPAIPLKSKHRLPITLSHNEAENDLILEPLDSPQHNDQQ